MKIKFTITGEIEVDKGWYDEGVTDIDIKNIEEDTIKSIIVDFVEGINRDSLKITTTISQ